MYLTKCTALSKLESPRRNWQSTDEIVLQVKCSDICLSITDVRGWCSTLSLIHKTPQIIET